MRSPPVAAIAAGKLAAGLSRFLGLGGGTALPGLVAQRLRPHIVPELAGQLGQGCILITGTNGKTTTARMVRNMVQAAGYRPLANRSGSNLMRGIAASLVEAADLRGRLPASGRRLGVFEVDEATLTEAAAPLRPRAVTFTNLFRDQLDRYGEVEHVAALWRQAVDSLPHSTTLILNADDPSIAPMGLGARGAVIYYGLADPACAVHHLEHAADARWCAACGQELRYQAVFYGHLGHWTCPHCDMTRPAVTVAGDRVESEAQGLALRVRLPQGELSLRLPLMGLYNAYNALAAVATALALALPTQAMEAGLASFTAAFGRQERLSLQGRQVQVILAKNPAGLNQVLRTITSDGSPKHLAFFLNDNIADGRDVSWIWDVDFEMLAGQTRSLVVSGRRAADMALRLKYAGVDSHPQMETDVATALRRAIGQTPPGETLYVIPTYTAMLGVRELLARWGGRAHFWVEG